MIQSIERALTALDYLVLRSLSGEGAPLQDISECMGVASSTAHNILKTMVQCGYVGRDEAGQYVLGPRCRDISRGSRLSGGLLAAATGAVHALAERTGESVVLATLAHGRRHPVLRAEGQSVIRVGANVEVGASFFSLVTGRVLASWASAEELAEILEIQGYPGVSWDGIHDDATLAAALHATREAGHAAQDERDRGLASLAVPVLEPGGQLVAALGVHLPAMRAEAEHLRGILEEMTAVAARLGRQA